MKKVLKFGIPLVAVLFGAVLGGLYWQYVHDPEIYEEVIYNDYEGHPVEDITSFHIDKETGAPVDGIYIIGYGDLDTELIRNSISSPIAITYYTDMKQRAHDTGLDENETARFVVVKDGKIVTLNDGATEQDILAKWREIY